MSSKKHQIPDIRFKGFTDAWEQRKLGDLAEVRTGKAFSSADFNDDGEYLVVTNKNIQDDMNGIASVGDRIDISEETILNNYLLKGNNILVTMDGVNIGKTGKYSNEKSVLAQRVGRLNSEQLEFIYQVTNDNKFLTEMNKLSVGNAIKHISLKQISDYSFAAPINEEEQNKIGTFFEQLDTTIALHQRQLNDYKQLKESMLQKMFPQDGEKVPEVRFEGFTEEWEQRKLNEIFDYKQGQQIPIEEQYDEPGENRKRFIRIIDLTSVNEPQRYIVYSGNNLIHKNDIFMVRYGKPGLAAYGYEGVIANNLFKMVPKELTNTPFYYTLLTKMRSKLENISSSTTMPALNFKSMDTLVIIVPNIDEQEKIGTFFKQLDNTIDLHQQKINDYLQLKNAMLQQLFV